MTKKYENVIVKDKKKIRKRVKIPITPLDFYTNFIIDYKNQIRKIKALQKQLEKIEWEAYQMYDTMKQVMLFIMKLKLGKKDLLKTLRDEVLEKEPKSKVDKNEDN